MNALSDTHCLCSLYGLLCCSTQLKEGGEHPDPVVENGTLNTVDPPPITYKHSLPQDIIKDGLISKVQLESIVYAGQRHQLLLADGARAGKSSVCLHKLTALLGCFSCSCSIFCSNSPFLA
jgi:P-loop containing NTP hydrolase pore-1